MQRVLNKTKICLTYHFVYLRENYAEVMNIVRTARKKYLLPKIGILKYIK